MPFTRSNRRSQRRRYGSRDDSSSNLEPVLIKGGNSLNFVSQWFFLWVFPLLKRTRSDPDFDPDSIELQKEETAEYTGERLSERWRQEQIDYKDKASISRALMSAFGRPYLLLAFYKVFWIIFTYLGAYFFVKRLISFVEFTPEEERASKPIAEGYLYALGIFLTCVGSSVCIQQVMAECTRIGVQVRAGLMVLIYRKSLKLPSAQGSISNIINLISNDCNRVAESFVNFHFLWSSALEILGKSSKLAAIPALVILILLFPVQYMLSFYTARINAMATSTTTARIHIMSELLTAIKLIKFYAWESYFRDRVTRVRAKEMRELRHGMYLKIASFAVVFTAPVLTTLACICVYELTEGRGAKGEVRAAVVFTILSLFNTLRYPLIMLPVAVKTTLGALLSFDRIDGFLRLPEVEPLLLHSSSDPTQTSGSDDSRSAADADFGWPESSESNPTLKFISMSVKPGELVAVVGDVGSGKSSTLAAIMGQIKLRAGDREVRGSLAYVPHDAWLVNASLKENILFGSPFNRQKYNDIIRVCALARDLTLLSAGDETEIGERGINLSQGQRQRVSLARAVYSNADILLLDDPLSGMDAQIGKHIFQECIKGYLANKSIIYVTNQLQHLGDCDHIIVMKGGSIEVQGTFAELKAKDVNLARIVEESMEIEDPDQIQELMSEVRLGPANNTDIGSPSNPASPTSEKGIDNPFGLPRTSTKPRSSLNRTSTRFSATDSIGDEGEELSSINSRGVVPGWSVAKAYLRKGTGMGVSAAVVLIFLFTHGLRIFSDYWLRFTVGPDNQTEFHFYLTVYGGLIGAVVVGVYARALFLSWIVFKKSHTYHDRIFRKILRAPMSYYDVTPLARILNAFARHLHVVDEILPDAILQMLQYLPLAIGAAVLVIVIVPWSAIAVVVLLLVVWGLIHLSSYTDERLKAMEAMTKGPIFAHMAATLDGLFSIRVYGAEKRFDTYNMYKIDDNHKALFAMMQVRSWQALYLDLVASVFVLVTAMFVVYFHRDGSLDAAEVGLAVTNALQLLIFGQWSVRMAAEIKSTKESVCQLELYGMNIPAEEPDYLPETQPPADWPSQGEIEFKKVVLRYQNYGVAVLKKVSFIVRPGEKVGVVGKMGSGKTTLLISLLRVVEAAEGKILIDNVDVREIGLHDLRSKIAIIPQEPVLFVGTIRSNLDPFHRRTDEEIWAALDAAHLSEHIKQNMPMKLETPIIENGRNFSLGQRQLFCIARAILFQSRILVLDEATSAVDLQTDLLIQETIKKNFAHCTVLMIAHRLNAIIECDKILVMEDGRVVEFEHPAKLIENSEGYFHNLVSQSGPDSVARLKTMLREHGQTVGGLPPIVAAGNNERRESNSFGTPHSDIVQENSEEDGQSSQESLLRLKSSTSTTPPSSSQNNPSASASSHNSTSASNLEGTQATNATAGEGPTQTTSTLAASAAAATVSSTTTHQMPRSLEDVFAQRGPSS
ncbi:MAG: P-loop containing nucleoside triphosphate hydrolase protein [Benniella sp.]|nr:MAG: P-loop containing nucleoside triphosphate hydrolase protein [Benniella sp.]